MKPSTSTSNSKKMYEPENSIPLNGFTIALIAVLLCIAGFFSVMTWERVDAGCEGIKVDLYGSDKGVNDVTLVTGMVWYNRWTTMVYEYPTYVKTVDYAAFDINAKDGAAFAIDPTISLKIKDGKSSIVFRKYRKELDEIINTTLYNYVKDAFRIELNKYTTDQIVSNRDMVERSIEQRLEQTLGKENFQLEQLTSGLRYPQVIVDAVNAKSKAIQEAERSRNELEVQKAEAEKMLVKARAEKEANELRNQSLTPAVLRKMWIEKWDGHLPETVAGSNADILLGVSK